MMRLLIVVACLIAVQIPSALAEAPPVPSRKTASLPAIQQQIEQEQKNKAQIESDMNRAEKEMAAAKKSLVNAAATVQAQEKILQSLQGRIEENERTAAEIGQSLQKDYGAVSDLILTLARLRRVPPEALIVRPGAPLQTAQSAMLLRGMLEGVNARAAALSQNLAALEKAQADMVADKADALAAKAALERKYDEIAALAEKRKSLYKDLNRDYRSSEAAVAKFAQEAKNLKDFMARIEERPEPSDEQYKRNPEERKENEKRPVFKLGGGGAGDARLPVYGTVSVSFGQMDRIGAESQGVTIEAQPGAAIVSPMKGVIKFSGEFKDYGPVVIIEHKGGYHSLMIGMDRITAVTGQRVDAGEPVGRLPRASSRGGPPALYYELRHKGRPVDPALKFTELKS